jgi:hypothetical protein
MPGKEIAKNLQISFEILEKENSFENFFEFGKIVIDIIKIFILTTGIRV